MVKAAVGGREEGGWRVDGWWRWGLVRRAEESKRTSQKAER